MASNKYTYKQLINVYQSTRQSFNDIINHNAMFREKIIKHGIQQTKYYEINPETVQTWRKVLEQTIVNNKAAVTEHSGKPKETCTVYVYNEDTIDCALRLQDQGWRPLVLNMASADSCGGGVKNGCTAQEEELFRRSTYELSLDDPYQLNSGKNWTYPITAPIYSIVSPNVCVFRRNQKTRYQICHWTDCRFLDFIAAAAIREPKLKQDGNYFNAVDHELMRSKINHIFETAILCKYDCLLLSAFGCGAYFNHPVVVARLFQEAIQKYKQHFAFIAFAILDGSTTNNCEIFRTILLPPDNNAKHC